MQILFERRGNGSAGLTYDQFETSAFTVTTGPHEILFQGINPYGDDNSVLLDEVVVIY